MVTYWLAQEEWRQSSHNLCHQNSQRKDVNTVAIQNNKNIMADFAFNLFSQYVKVYEAAGIQSRGRLDRILFSG